MNLPDGNIGEAWLTDVSCICMTETGVGRPFSELVEEFGVDLLGEQGARVASGAFPLLAKIIDARDRLSVQVHPGNEYARAHGLPAGKTEAWYVLAAEPGARVLRGFREAVNEAQVRRAIEDGSMADLLKSVSVQAGDVIYVPAGMVHAIGAGVLLYEIQQYADVTYRFFDYERLGPDGKPRDLHIDQALAVADLGVPERDRVVPLSLHEDGQLGPDKCLAACEYFVLNKLLVRGETRRRSMSGSSCAVITAVDGELLLIDPAGGYQIVHLGRGETAVLPARLGDYDLAGKGTVLYAYVPAPGDEMLRQWRHVNAA